MNTTQHYIEWMYPGLFVSETSIEKVENRNKPEVVPKYTYGYRFFDREEISINGEMLKGDKKNQSGIVYLGAKLMSLDDVKNMDGEHKILITNMECNSWEYVVLTRCGNFFKWHKDDKIQTVFFEKL